MSDGTEILLYEHRRRPPCWTNVILPHQYAVFLRNEEWKMSVGRDGKPREADRATCILFESIDDAESFCRRLVAQQPRICCEVLDSAGRAKPPLLTITSQHSGGGDDDMRGWLGRHRRSLIAGLIAAALPLFWYDWRHNGDLIMTVLGVNMIAAALRLLLWDVGAKNTERDRIARLDAHRARERGAADQSSKTTASV
jgi:hypothetical protein